MDHETHNTIPQEYCHFSKYFINSFFRSIKVKFLSVLSLPLLLPVDLIKIVFFTLINI
jgi:hypothetical protein